MDVTASDLTRIPAGNLRVSCDEFAALWLAAEQRMATGSSDWYAGGVVVTCRWLAAATVRPATGAWHPARSPVTRRTVSAYPELIETEHLAAEKQLARRPVPTWLQHQPGWALGIVTTFNWVWRRVGAYPLDVDPRQ
ncbi:hypothetical protein CFN78_13545 [Amycolatopsis antarctica]|uniref:Uncharacterized protein n=1 Tax=Amycolatopsis antarctica TaxID=1854586 RepID=A0A263D5I6_9PSEU|nr:hypothetical protein [Amycolatopsis antarctica]OZM72655.1 hypothetical protein CFN78_13545 [Amycolatopsis antarctica]